MARYKNTIKLDKKSELVKSEIADYLNTEGFKVVRYKGREEVYKKGFGLMAAPQYIKVTYDESEAIVEAWMKFVILPNLYIGELSLECFDLFTGVATVKGKLRKRVKEIEKILSNVDD